MSEPTLEEAVAEFKGYLDRLYDSLQDLDPATTGFLYHTIASDIFRTEVYTDLSNEKSVKKFRKNLAKATKQIAKSNFEDSFKTLYAVQTASIRTDLDAGDANYQKLSNIISELDSEVAITVPIMAHQIGTKLISVIQGIKSILLKRIC